MVPVVNLLCPLVLAFAWSQEEAKKTCCLCKEKGVGRHGQGGFLRARNVGGKRVYVHENCARFCPKVREDERGNLENVGNEIRRGNGLVCARVCLRWGLGSVGGHRFTGVHRP